MGKFNCITLSADQFIAAAAHAEDLLYVWKSPENEPGKFTTTMLPGYVYSMAFSPDNRTLVTASCRGKTVQLWDVSGDTPKEKDTLTLGNVTSVAFSPDNRTLVTAYWEGKTVKLWDVSGDKPKEKVTLTGHSYDNPECTCNHYAGEDENEYEADPSCPVTGHSESVESVAFSPDNRTLATAFGNTVQLWDVSGDKPKKKRTLTGHSDDVRCVAWSPDGSKLVSGSDDKTLKIWDPTMGKEVCTLTGHSNTVWSMTFSPDNKTLASASDEGTVKLWDVSGDTPKKKRAPKWHSDEFISMTFSPDNKTLASASRKGTVKLWGDLNATPTDYKTIELWREGKEQRKRQRS